MKGHRPACPPPGRAGTRAFSALALAAALLAPLQAARADGPVVYVVNTGTGMMAEILAHGMANGSPAVLWPHYGGTSQQFEVWLLEGNDPYQPEEERWFLLKALHSGKCLMTDGFQNGAPIVQSECGGHAAQMWRVRLVSMTAAECGDPNQCFGGFRRVLENYYDRGRRCLDAANGAFPAPQAQGTGLQAWDCIPTFSAPNAINQEWELVNINDWGAAGPVVH